MGRDNHFLGMARLLALTALVTLSLGQLKAQTHGDHLMLGVGASYPNGLEANLGYEHETEYHNAWEFWGSYYIKYDKDPEVGHITSESFWHNYNTWLLGVAYKPCVTRGRNYHGNLRLGGSGGSDLDKWLGAMNLGYEHTYNLYNGWSFYFQVKEDIVFRGKDTFRTGVVLGIKIPF